MRRYDIISIDIMLQSRKKKKRKKRAAQNLIRNQVEMIHETLMEYVERKCGIGSDADGYNKRDAAGVPKQEG